ncbi:MAG: Asp-tRNA(Asn)/Glu-tRNA(Gln) amidotransferase subunit GatB [Acidimicrobiia bacterium]|nr:Asp-tRNA(Asn)/Glu-tRNA(Gln) amidotransferase subunit GatB [Acidimicrobiia bacterium]MBT8191947.1 Asp-tRNA(Asn)/Glu-tRNA(Gln) amidotransferase subunit GatB [Acidimicrobiia bacterium]NNF87560.1 Asp-tRNA(Asn)/Glu-tRNA(Gln) amidotransferase subunit GatB [Acidimicrobiia bacterium]NNJ47231.1 Asp-tRNA(Asn)/Glu-tRNA(Gln) amidotransferase subunit GatB [Acidimicrobiia bacterium]NNL13951.1 Asp-tRNA(Asn)/Glu-tRNA(Gln) amidotransferase subunit GatB [Acidimicrobiia bacterium]
MAYEPVIGIETHVELTTASKMFCGCPVDFGAPPNTNVCPVCLGLPGALPVVNGTAVEYAMTIGLALNCDIAAHSVFARKNYFYPDMPKNYQISQFDEPLCVDGHLDIDTGDGPVPVGITRVHMEEDTGKSTHIGEGGRIHAATHSLIDFNRAGVPLMEIVSEPDIRSAEQARAFVTELREVVLRLGVSDAKLEEGSMRFDGNISLRPEGTEAFGTKVEIKNMNSIRSLQRALNHEIERQTALLEAGEAVVQETRHWNEETGTTSGMRSKEESFDYRYFPEPDLVPVAVDDEWRERVTARLPELPAQAYGRYLDMGLDGPVAAVISRDVEYGSVFEAAVAAGGTPQMVANWLTGEVTALLRRTESTLAESAINGTALAELSSMVADGTLSASAAKDVLAGVAAGEGTPDEVAASRDLVQVSDSAALEPIVDEVLAANAEAVEKLRAGDGKVVGFLIGQVMRATGGKADPGAVSEIIRSRAG